MAEIVSISIPKGSAGEIEALQKTLGLKGRSELIRTAVRSLANETKGLGVLKGTVNALLVVTHAHNEGIGKIFHQNEKLIATHVHQHIGEKCVEIFLLKGEAVKIRIFSNALLRDKHVLGAKLVIV
jgi:metal-responsive CopG/Arc/MetJ family transcriptional regulator